MKEILGKAKTVRNLLTSMKYSIDHYQREYNWGDKQVQELIADLSSKFIEDYDRNHSRSEVINYPHYFLGSIIVSKKDNVAYIVDGQQRLTSLTLLLILLRNLQKENTKKVNIDELIFSEKYGVKSFNIDVTERTPAMEALYEDQNYDTERSSISVQNIIARYRTMESTFPAELSGYALPYFTDWILENVQLVEITAYSDDDAYTIFETMNDRGLSLSPTDMLKGYLLAKVEENKRTDADELWRTRIHELSKEGKDVAADCFKAWFRAQYATKIRERKKGACPENFDRIGTEFHRWIRDGSTSPSLRTRDDVFEFITRDFDFYSRQYLRIVRATKTPDEDLRHVHYNAQNGFNLQYMLVLAPLRTSDSASTILRKVELVAHYLDILLTWRLWNSRTISHSAMQYSIFLVMRDIRGLALDELAYKLYALLGNERETFDSSETLRMHQQNRFRIHRMLARITDYVEVQSGRQSRYPEYVSSGANRYEIEHIWADHWELHKDEFSDRVDFAEHRNRIGGLLLLPRDFNASFGDLEYAQKRQYYTEQNLLVRSLHPQCYEHNPNFLNFLKRSGLMFAPHESFNMAALKERSELYRQIAKRVWNRDDLLKEVQA